MLNCKKILFLIISVVFLSSFTQAQKKAEIEPNYNGVWNLEKVSNATILPLDKFTSWYEQKISTISIKKDETKFEVSVLGQNGNSVLVMEFNLNGKGETNESPFRIYDRDKNQTFSDYQTFKSSTKQDGRTIISKAEIKVDLYGTLTPVKRTVEWKLSKDGTELSETVALEKEGGVRRGGYSKEVFEIIENITFTRKYKLEK